MKVSSERSDGKKSSTFVPVIISSFGEADRDNGEPLRDRSASSFRRLAAGIAAAYRSGTEAPYLSP
jgi:hypothetical protein